MGPSGIHPKTLAERTAIYSRALDLQRRGVRQRKIARILGVSTDLVSWWLRGHPPKREQYVPNLQPSSDLAYLIGAYLGDGRTAGPNDKKVRFKVASREFANSLNELVAKILGRPPKSVKMEEGFYCVDYDSAALYDFLQQSLANLMPFIDAFPNAFLRGFFDAEGYVSASMDHKGRILQSMVVGAANTNLDYLDLVSRLLATKGILGSTRRTNKAGQPMTIRGKTSIRKNNVYHFLLRGVSRCARFREEIGFNINGKREKLEDLLWLMRTKNPSDRYAWFVANYAFINRRWIKNHNYCDNILE